jgi:DNA-binding SARP family transcriptional activator/streptogramin lyase
MVEFRILGPLEVVEAGNPVALGTLKERLVLAVLLLHANEFVSRERLIDDLWGEAPPPTARKAINVYVSQLRKTLGRPGADPIVTASGGYRLRVDPEMLDANRMQLLVASARECVSDGELERAADGFREALALWRGPTLAGLQLESRGRDEVAQLDELRLTALMDRIDGDLALGRPELVLGELNTLVHDHPLRERLRAQQMLALYRADRQAEALDAYAEARRTLLDDLGIEPSEALQRLQHAILRHETSLETPSGTAAVNGLPPTKTAPAAPVSDAEIAEGGARKRFRARRWQLALAGLAIVAGSAVAAARLTHTAGATPHVVPNSLVRIDPRSGKIVSDTPIGVQPWMIAPTPNAIWTVVGSQYGSNAGTNIARYDLRTHKVQKLGRFVSQPFGIVADATGNVWVSSFGSSVTRLAFSRGGSPAGALHPSHTSYIPIPPPGAGSLALGPGYLWAIAGPITTPGLDNRVWLVDRATNQVVRSLQLAHETTAIAFGDGAAWIGGFATERTIQSGPPPWTGASWLSVVRAAASVHSYRLEVGDTAGPSAVAVGYRKVWVLTHGPGPGIDNQQLLEFDPHKREVVNDIQLGSRKPNSLAVGAGSVWLTNQIDASVTQLDPRTGRIIRTIPVGEPRTAATCGIAATRDAVWVTVGDRHCVSSGP